LPFCFDCFNLRPLMAVMRFAVHVVSVTE
jgi:hypothetical protein